MTPAPSRPASSRGRKKQRTGQDLVGSEVYIPSSVFNPSHRLEYLHGVVKGHDSVHRGHMIVKCSDDGGRFFFPIDMLRLWTRPPEAQASHPGPGPDSPEALDQGAVQSPSIERGASVEPSVEPASAAASAAAGAWSEGADSEADPGREDTVESAQGGGARPAAAPARRRKRSRGRLSVGRRPSTSKGEVRDLIGRALDVPGWVFNVEVPDVYYTGRVLGPDSAHGNSVVVKLKDDPTRYFFSAPEVRQWLQRTEAGRGSEDEEEGSGQWRRTTGPGADVFAAEVLMDISQCSRKRKELGGGGGERGS